MGRSEIVCIPIFEPLNHIHQLIQELRDRSDLGTVDQTSSWTICIAKAQDLICEVTVPHDVLEWFATVKHRREEKELWSDWMDYSGYNDKPHASLEAEMASDILAFVNKVSIKEPLLPLEIHDN